MINADRFRRAAIVLILPLLIYRLLLVLLIPAGSSDAGQIGVLLAAVGGVLTFGICLTFVVRHKRRTSESAE